MIKFNKIRILRYQILIILFFIKINYYLNHKYYYKVYIYENFIMTKCERVSANSNN